MGSVQSSVHYTSSFQRLSLEKWAHPLGYVRKLSICYDNHDHSNSISIIKTIILLVTLLFISSYCYYHDDVFIFRKRSARGRAGIRRLPRERAVLVIHVCGYAV